MDALDRGRHDVSEALRAYESVRRERTARVQLLARERSVDNHLRDEESIRARDQRFARIRQQAAAGNHAYEEKFGRVFLIRAAGRTATEILAALRTRLTHSPAEEDAIVAQQLREIAVLRLEGVISE